MDAYCTIFQIGVEDVLSFACHCIMVSTEYSVCTTAGAWQCEGLLGGKITTRGVHLDCGVQVSMQQRPHDHQPTLPDRLKAKQYQECI